RHVPADDRRHRRTAARAGGRSRRPGDRGLAVPHAAVRRVDAARIANDASAVAEPSGPKPGYFDNSMVRSRALPNPFNEILNAASRPPSAVAALTWSVVPFLRLAIAAVSNASGTRHPTGRQD